MQYIDIHDQSQYQLGLKQILQIFEYLLRIWYSEGKTGTRVLVKIT